MAAKPLRLFCCFCAGALARGRPSAQWRCRGCGARFVVEQEPGGCAVGLRVADCGTPECCRGR